jgi:hypothetical protein
MYARSSTLAMLATVSLAFSLHQTSSFTLGATGAIAVNAAGTDARYGRLPAAGQGPRIGVSLGPTNPAGSVQLIIGGTDLTVGRYAVSDDWTTSERVFHASFAAGSPERPLGWFEAASGWVTVTAVSASEVRGEYEIRARGWLSSDPDNENRWVTVRGTFRASAESASPMALAPR